jgi:hypothetical protein
MTYALNHTLAAKKKYASPRTETLSVRLSSSLLAVSGTPAPPTAPITGGGEQIYAW